MADNPPEALPLEFPGMALVQQERIGQVMREGFTPAHDVQHRGQELAWAAWCYLNRASETRDEVAFDPTPPLMWPPGWSVDLWKPGPTRVRMLVKAGALIAAEIDRRLAQGEL
jgi:hypothetical protein